MPLKSKKKRRKKIPPKLYVGEWIDRLGYKRKDAAAAAKISESYISEISSGKRGKTPWLGVFFALADFLKLPAEAFRYPPPPRLDIENTQHVDPAQLANMAKRLADLTIGGATEAIGIVGSERMIIVFGYVILAVVAGIIASSRGRNAFGYFALGLLITPIVPIVLALALPNLALAREQEAEQAQARQCPRCAERIKKAATVCRYCGYAVAPLVEARLQLPKFMPLSTGAMLRRVALIAILGFLAIMASRQFAMGPGEGRVETSAPPMATTQAVPFVDTSTGALPVTKPPPAKDAKPKAPPGPLRITPP